jgi:hypothetical protein
LLVSLLNNMKALHSPLFAEVIVSREELRG